MKLINLFFVKKKGVYPHEYMNGWEKFNKTTLSEKEGLYNN